MEIGKIEELEKLVAEVKEDNTLKKEKFEELKKINPSDFKLLGTEKYRNNCREFYFQSKNHGNVFIKFIIREISGEFPLEEILYCDRKNNYTRLIFYLGTEREIIEQLWEKFFQEFKNDEVMRPLRTKYLFIINK